MIKIVSFFNLRLRAVLDVIYLQMLGSGSIKKDGEFERDKEKIFKYFNETRSSNQIQLTNHLVRSISDLNIQLLNHHPLTSTSANKTIKKEDFLYVCVNGVPPFDKEFQFLQLPGQCLEFPYPAFDKRLTGDQVIQLRTEFTQLAHTLHEKINQASTTKPIVFVYHSFGSYVFASYCQLYKTDRIIGIIDIGGGPIRFYPLLKMYLSGIWGLSLEELKENMEQAFKQSNQAINSVGVKSYDRKQQLYAMCKTFKSNPGFKQMFEYNRNYPKVLKCFILGRKDTVFTEGLINQKMAFYSYNNKFEEEYDANLKNTYLKCLGKKCDNVQERFIYSLDNGHHSVHMQKKYKQVNVKIVHRYLAFLQELHASKDAKL